MNFVILTIKYVFSSSEHQIRERNEEMKTQLVYILSINAYRTGFTIKWHQQKNIALKNNKFKAY